MNLLWTKKEFETYVLLYAAHANHIEDKKENSLIRSLVDDNTFNRIHTEVVIDSEKENLNKIQAYFSENSFSENERENLLRNVKKVLFADGSVDNLEKNVFFSLKKIIE